MMIQQGENGGYAYMMDFCSTEDPTSVDVAAVRKWTAHKTNFRISWPLYLRWILSQNRPHTRDVC